MAGRSPRIGLLVAMLAALGASIAPTAQAAGQGATNLCAQPPTPGGREITLTSSGVQRTALLHLPPAAAGERLPLLVGLHGAGAGFFERYSGFSVLADAEGFAALYPNPIDEADGRTFWNINDHQPHGPDDVQFISDLLNYVESSVCVNTSRVYAAGVSNGGGMAASAVCALSDRFAAFASIAGGYESLPRCQPTNPVSVLEIHGTEDGSVPYNGSRSTGAGAVRPWVAAWRLRDQCHGAPAVSRISPRVERYEWSNRAEGTAVEHIKIFGGNHQLPGGLPPDRGQASTISASWWAWSFLRQHRQAGPYTVAAARARRAG